MANPVVYGLDRQAILFEKVDVRVEVSAVTP